MSEKSLIVLLFVPVLPILIIPPALSKLLFAYIWLKKEEFWFYSWCCRCIGGRLLSENEIVDVSGTNLIT